MMDKCFYFVLTRIGSSTRSIVFDMYFVIITIVRAWSEDLGDTCLWILW